MIGESTLLRVSYENLLRKVQNLELANEHLNNSLLDITSKYESLRDVDSPVKEVSQMKKLVKINDESINVLKAENKDLKMKLKEIQEKSNDILLENPIIEELKKKILSFESENDRLKKFNDEIKEKYENLRDIDSPVKEVSHK